MMNLKNKVLPLVTGTALTVAACVPVFAAEDPVESALTTSFTSVGTSMTSVISKILPIALPIIGAVMVVSLGIKIFKRVTGKA